MAKKVLLADDEMDIQKVVEFRLKKAGYDVVLARDGKEALDLSRQSNPDLILMDYRMPIMSGKDVCIELRKLTEFKQIPIIMITASTETITKESLAQWGANDIIFKPFTPDELFAKVSQYLEVKRMTGKIMIAEDEPDVAKVLEKRLASSGFEVRSVPDAMMAVSGTHKFMPDLILLDILMPAGGGLAVLKNLKMSVHTKDIPVIVVTGMQDDALEKKIRIEGIAALFRKPYNYDELLSAIQKELEKKRKA